MFRTLLFLSLVLLCTGCALPAPEFEPQEFVPKREVLAASLYQEGTLLYQAGRYAEAELAFRKVDALYPDTENTKFNLALAIRGEGNFEEAVRILQELIEQNPEYTDYQIHLAETYYRAGRFDESIRDYKALFQKFEVSQELPKQALVARSLASILFERGYEDEAICYSMIAYQQIGGAIELVRHARILIATGRFEGAFSLLKDFLNTYPDTDDPTIWKEITISLIGLERVTDAAEYFDRATAKLSGAPDAELLPIGLYLEANGIEGAGSAAMQASRGGGKEVEEDNDSEVQISALKALNSALYLFWPSNLTSFVIEQIELLDNE